MNKQQKVKLYESIMRDLSVHVRQRLDEDTFKAPRKNVKERFLTLLGKESGYKERVRRQQEEYFEEKRRPFLTRLMKARSFSALLALSIDMSKAGYQFPVAGMVQGDIEPENTVLNDVVWLSFSDNNKYIMADTLSYCETGKENDEELIYTYFYSWRYWCRTILQILFYPNDPWTHSDDSKIDSAERNFAPNCPIVSLYKDLFKK
jgi:hypothetical protein